MKLKEIRERIDQIDSHILENLEERIKLAFQAASEKTHIFDPEREKEVWNRIQDRAKKSPWVKEAFVEKIFSEIITECRRVQQWNPPSPKRAFPRKEEP